MTTLVTLHISYIMKVTYKVTYRAVEVTYEVNAILLDTLYFQKGYIDN